MSSSPREMAGEGDEAVTTPAEGVLGLHQGAKKCAGGWRLVFRGDGFRETLLAVWCGWP
jgi:hypothetical protein